jgi:8-oxo-dGTP pyrophosphatase MutT (NUDIX family)
MTTPTRRLAARVLLLDAQQRLLLFHGIDPQDDGAGSWWFTPGGGIDPGESGAEGAARELFEETGLRCSAAELGEPVFESEVEFAFAGVLYAQHQSFFLLRVDSHDVDTSGFEALEASAIVDHRWWTREELRSTSETVYPLGVADVLDRLS